MIAPDLFEPVIGYRAFSVEHDGTMRSQYSDVLWPMEPGSVMTARCEVGHYFGQMPTFSYMKGEDLVYEPFDEHPAPNKLCGCGIHAHYDVGDASETSIPWSTDAPLVTAVGLIVGWGTVIPHPDGFRCQYATVCAMAGPSNAALEAARRLDIMYVRSKVLLPSLAQQFGGDFPTDLRPDPAAHQNNHDVTAADRFIRKLV